MNDSRRATLAAEGYRLPEDLTPDPPSPGAESPRVLAGGTDALLGAVHPVTFGQRLSQLTPRIWVTPLVIAANIAVYLWMTLHGASAFAPSPATILAWGANYGPRTSAEPWRLFSSMFVHIGLLHIAFNMLVLYDIGRLMERLLGNLGMAALYLTSGLAGSLLAVLVHPYIISAGASGAIFGLYGGLLGLLASRRLAIPGSVLKGLRNSTLAFVAYNLLFGAVVPGIDLTCHIGGLASGFLCGLAVAQPLDPRALPGRPIRAVFLALLSVGVLAAAGHLPRYPDLESDVSRFARTEHDTLTELRSGFQRWQHGKESRVQLATELRRHIVPPWRQAKLEFAGMKNLPAPQAKTVRALLFYLDARLEALDTLEQALRLDDGHRFSQGIAELRRSEQIAEQFGAPATR